MSKQAKLLGTDDHGAPSPARGRAATAGSRGHERERDAGGAGGGGGGGGSGKHRKDSDERAAHNAAQSAPTPNVPLGGRKEKLIAEGFLKKKSPKGVVKVWQSRWFRLFEGSLQYFKSKESKEPNGVIPIFSIKYINPHKNKGKKPGRFDVVIGDNNSERIFALMATSDRSAETWVAVLQKVIAAYQKVAKEGTLTGNTVMNASHMDSKFWKDQQKVANLRAQNQSKLAEIDSKLAAQRAVAKKTVVLPSMEIIKEESPAAIGSVFTVRLRPSSELDMKLDEQLKFCLHSIAKMDEGYVAAMKLFEEMRKLDHQYFPSQVHYGEANDTLFAVYTPPLRAQDALISYLERHRRFPPDVVQFYAAQLVVALGYIHSLQMTFRNLSPEFIFFAADGRLMVGDFLVGLPSAQMPPECGEPEYTSPENKTTGDTASSDWWRLGVLLYEVSVGIPPFRSRLDGEEKVTDIEQQVANFKPETLRFPPFVAEELRDLIKHLLTLDPRKRLGASEADWQEVKAHAFFKDINWEQVEAVADTDITVPEWVKLNVIERYAPLPIPANYARGGVPRFEGSLLVEAIAGRDLPGDRPSTFCSVRLNHESRGMAQMQDTKTIRRNGTPQWKSQMAFDLPAQAIDEPHAFTVVVEVIKAEDEIGQKRKKDEKNVSPLIGSVVTSLHNVKHWYPEAMDSWQTIIDHKGLPSGEIHMSYKWQQHRVKLKRTPPELCVLSVSLFDFFGRPTPRPSISGLARDDSTNSHSRKDSVSGPSGGGGSVSLSTGSDSYNSYSSAHSSHSHLGSGAYTPSSSFNSSSMSMTSISETNPPEDVPPPPVVPMTPSSAAVASILAQTAPINISDEDDNFPPPPPVATTPSHGIPELADTPTGAFSAPAGGASFLIGGSSAPSSSSVLRAPSMVAEMAPTLSHDLRAAAAQVMSPSSLALNTAHGHGTHTTIGEDHEHDHEPQSAHEDEEASDQEEEDMAHVTEAPPADPSTVLAAEAAAAREAKEHAEAERERIQKQADASEHARLEAEQRAAEKKAAASAEEREALRAQLEAELRAQVEREIRQKAEEDIRKAELEMRARLEREQAAKEALASPAHAAPTPSPAVADDVTLPPPPLNTADASVQPTITTTPAEDSEWSPPPPPVVAPAATTVASPSAHPPGPAVPPGPAIPSAKPSSRSPSPARAATPPTTKPKSPAGANPGPAIPSPVTAASAKAGTPKPAATSTPTATSTTPLTSPSGASKPKAGAPAVGAPPPPPAFLVGGGAPRANAAPKPADDSNKAGASAAAAAAAKDKASRERAAKEKAKVDAEMKKSADEAAAKAEADKLKLDQEEAAALESARQERLKTENAVREEAKRKAKEAADKAEREKKRQEEEAKAAEEARKKAATESSEPEGDGMCKDPKCDCGPDMYSPDPFKKGKCATCFHEHNPQPATRRHRPKAPANKAAAKSPSAAAKGGATSAAAKGIAGGCLECMCGPAKFSVNPFKKNGCNTCFHEHLPQPGPGGVPVAAAAPKSALVAAATAVIPQSAPSAAPAPLPVPQAAPSPAHGGGGCGTCGCVKYEKDPFKDRCSNCFHKH